MTVLLCKDGEAHEVVTCDPARDHLTLLHWTDEDHGVMYDTKISVMNARGFVAVARDDNWQCKVEAA